MAPSSFSYMKVVLNIRFICIGKEIIGVLSTRVPIIIHEGKLSVMYLMRDIIFNERL